MKRHHLLTFLIAFLLIANPLVAADKPCLRADEAPAARAYFNWSMSVIGIASIEQLKTVGLLERAQKACSVLLDNHAPADDGLFKDKSGKAFIPTFTTANPVVAWAWCAELFAACTRRGKTPAMYKSVM